MSSSNDVRYFNGTCEEFELASCTGAVLNSRFLDPCSCSRFYRCTQTYEIIAESCGEDTLWDADLGQCNHAHEVRIKQACEPNNSWLRCNTTEERLLQLEHICTKTPTTTVLPTTGSTIETTTAPPSGSSDTNIGLIVGLSITSVVVIVLIVLFVLYRRKHRGIKKKRGTIAHNPEYFESGNHDDPYAVIDERLTSPVYSTQTQGRTNGGFSNTGYSMSRTEEATYDNSVARTPEPGYTSTLNRSFREYGTVATNRTPQQTTSDGTTTVNQTDDVVNGVQTKRSTLLDENGNRSSSESSNNSVKSNTNDVETLKDQTLSDLARAKVSEADADDDPAMHDYLVLHPTNDHL